MPSVSAQFDDRSFGNHTAGVPVKGRNDSHRANVIASSSSPSSAIRADCRGFAFKVKPQSLRGPCIQNRLKPERADLVHRFRASTDARRFISAFAPMPTFNRQQSNTFGNNFVAFRFTKRCCDNNGPVGSVFSTHLHLSSCRAMLAWPVGNRPQSTSRTGFQRQCRSAKYR